MSTPLGTLDRGLAVLDYLASVREASATEIAGALTLSRSTTYRLIDRLDQAGYVDAAASGRWRLGAAASRLAMAAVHSTDVVHAAPDLLRSLAQQTRETVGLGVFSADEMIFVYRERGQSRPGRSARPGRPTGSNGPWTASPRSSPAPPKPSPAAWATRRSLIHGGGNIRNMCRNVPLEDPMPFYHRVGAR